MPLCNDIKIHTPRFIENQTPIVFQEPQYNPTKPADIALFAILKDCAPRVREWLAFHYVQGVRFFALVLHGDSDGTEREIDRLPFRDLIVIHHLDPDTVKPQIGSYRKLFEYYRDCARWVAVLDDDEFLYPVEKDKSLLDVLERYAAYGGVTVNWEWFGSNNNVVRPDGLVIEAYTKKAGKDFPLIRGCKSIIRSRAYHNVKSPHLCWTDPVCCDTKYRPINPEYHWETGYMPTNNVLRINHYKVKSMEDWCVRVRRGDCTIVNPKPVNVDRFKTEDRNDIEDLEILRYVQQVKALLHD